uniref:General transcription factor IIF subunit 2 n=1 Tax=Panagrellus redivivus TaxID=6233 RepID=A0A7E4VRZ2_PANRE
MRMKCNRICKAMQPVRMVQKVDKAVVAFKPTNQHAENVMKEKTKKDQGARVARASREAVMDMIFQAFEKHQYYKLVDLQAITKQPQNFIREILTDIAVYNTAPPHKSMWELKQEYRNYKQSADEPMEQ